MLGTIAKVIQETLEVAEGTDLVYREDVDIEDEDEAIEALEETGFENPFDLYEKIAHINKVYLYELYKIYENII